MTEDVKPSLIDRTLWRLRRGWRDIAASARVAMTGAVRPNLPDDDAARLKRRIVECLEGLGGEVSARARAADLGRTYLTLNSEGRARFLTLLALDFTADRGIVDGAIAAVQEASDPVARQQAEAALRRALVPPRLTLLRQFNALPEGVKFLVDLRADILQLRNEDPALHGLEGELRELLNSWFDVGFLDLRLITWDSPAALLEKLIAYEAVHEIRSWTDLKNRLDSDRRCFAFFHPEMENEPLIFVEVALVRGLADNIQDLLDESAPNCDPNEADTAIFYSISNAQIGLTGISFGNFLIKRVVDQLTNEFKGLKTFATLSPMSGFRSWLDSQIDADAENLMTSSDARNLAEFAGIEGGGAALRAVLGTPWHTDAKAVQHLARPLQRLCARYLLSAADNGRSLDRVAHFHLSNGARIERINWLADTSPKGIERSAGMMINYLYKLEDIEENHEVYTGEGRIVASASVRSLL